MINEEELVSIAAGEEEYYLRHVWMEVISDSYKAGLEDWINYLKKRKELSVSSGGRE